MPPTPIVISRKNVCSSGGSSLEVSLLVGGMLGFGPLRFCGSVGRSKVAIYQQVPTYVRFPQSGVREAARTTPPSRSILPSIGIGLSEVICYLALRWSHYPHPLLCLRE